LARVTLRTTHALAGFAQREGRAFQFLAEGQVGIGFALHRGLA
jgi:hypothetical protein